MISINSNLMASNVANTLTSHYGRLSTSVERLSSGLRINSAADDAAGLAIREMMRADIAALNQGVRNANDAISMIQTFDGALGVIDEKLIRMKELAEQAATGTYTSDQRLMIDNEFKAMGDEINRIARSTDFNGIKLIDGAFEASGTQITAPDGKTYDIVLTDSAKNFMGGAGATAQIVWTEENIKNAITDPGALIGTHTITIKNQNLFLLGDANLVVVDTANTGAPLTPGTLFSIDLTPDTPAQGFTEISINNGAPNYVGPNASSFSTTVGGTTYNFNLQDLNGNSCLYQDLPAISTTWTAQQPGTFTKTSGPGTLDPVDTTTPGIVAMTIDLGSNNKITQRWDLQGTDDRVLSEVTFKLKITDTSNQPDTDPNDPMNPNYKIPDDVVRVHFGPGADHKEDFYDIKKHDATLKGLGLDGVKIDTQEKAQNALAQVNDAIVEKDKIRAEFGATQNRLENTITNLTTQSENLQAAESRISDADIAREMTTFVRNQVLTNSAVAMLAQANSVPQMVMRLIGA